MNKAKLIETLTEKTNQKINKSADKIGKKQSEAMLETLAEIIIEELKNDHEVTITGFGTFTSMTRYARGGVNPRKPQERITIPAVKVAKFRTGKNLKEALKS
ncbi:MAG: HU family DNA-binding protein [Patescibacteria group bacterium]|jgi:DNA-binding protein HU-beta